MTHVFDSQVSEDGLKGFLESLRLKAGEENVRRMELISRYTVVKGNVRPKNFEEIIGQSRAIDALRTTIAFCKKKESMPGHILLTGPAGHGKTSLAGVFSQEVGFDFTSANTSSFGSAADLLRFLLKNEGKVVFLDEIHQVSRFSDGTEGLLTIIEDFMHEGERVVPFTLVGATTDPHMLAKPLRERFRQSIDLDEYSITEITQIVTGAAQRMDIPGEVAGFNAIAQRALRNPRKALALLDTVHMWTETHGNGYIDKATADHVLKLRGYDSKGLTGKHMETLRSLSDKTRPVGIATLAQILRLQRPVLEGVYLNDLLGLGFIEQTGRGIQITEDGRNHINQGEKK